MTSPAWVSPRRTLDVDAFHRRWTTGDGRMLALHGVTHHHDELSNDEFELDLRTESGQQWLLYVYDVLDLATGVLIEAAALPPTADDLARVVGFLLRSLDQWADLDRIRPDTVPDLLRQTRPEVTSALLTLQTATSIDAPDILRNMAGLSHTDPGFVAAALLAGLTPTEASLLPSGKPNVMTRAQRQDLLDQWRFLAGLRGAPT